MIARPHIGRPLSGMPTKWTSREYYNAYMRDYMRRRRKGKITSRETVIEREACRGGIRHHAEPATLTAFLLGDPPPGRRELLALIP